MRTHFCTEVALAYGGLISPKKNGLKGTIPAFTKRRFGSSAIKDADGTTVCFSPWLFPDSKKLSQRDLISAEFTLLLRLLLGFRALFLLSFGIRTLLHLRHSKQSASRTHCYLILF